MHAFELQAREQALAIAEAVLRLPPVRPAEAGFMLLVQLRRAAIAVPAQLAQATAQAARGDRLRGLALVPGTLAELDALLELAGRSQVVESGTVLALRAATGELAQRVRAALRDLDPPMSRERFHDAAHDD